MPELQSKIYKWVFFLNTVYIRLQRCTNRTHAAGVSHLNSVTRSHSLRDSLLHVSTLLTVSAACSSKPFDFFSNLDHVLDPGVNLFSFFLSFANNLTALASTSCRSLNLTVAFAVMSTYRVAPKTAQ